MTDEPQRDKRITAGDAAAILRDSWGIVAAPKEVGSLGDQVFDIKPGNSDRAALKIYNIGQDIEALDAEQVAIELLAVAFPALAFPLEIPPTGGRAAQVNGRAARLVTWVDGENLGNAPYLTQGTIVELGRMAGRCSVGLHEFDHPGLHRHSPWDLRNTLAVVEEVRASLPSAVLPSIEHAVAVLETTAQQLQLDELPLQAVHGDLTDLNVLGTRLPDGSFSVDGVIDFGDIIWTWRICELAATAHAAIGRQPEDPLGALLAALSGYRDLTTLTEAEAECLWHLTLRRATVCAAMESIEQEAHPDNLYAAHVAGIDTAALRAMIDIHPAIAVAVVREAAGYEPTATKVGRMIAETELAPLLPLNSITSVASRWGEVECLDGPEALLPNPPALRTYVLVQASRGTPIAAPVDAVVVESNGSRLALACELGDQEFTLTLQGVDHELAMGARISGGDSLGVLGSHTLEEEGQLLVHVGAEAALPHLGAVRDKAALAALCPDPSRLLGIAPISDGEMDAAGVRKKYLAPSQSLYYTEPAQIIRGRGQWLWDRTGQRLLDGVNNVAAVGHAHPRITEAASEQLKLHNTNSRFLYDATAEFAELVAQTLPAELQSLFFVNSGSEAVELALELARTYTGRRDIVVLEGSYHGWTSEAFELCTMPADRPDWRESLSPNVRVAPTPDPYRGPFGHDTDAYLDALDVVLKSTRSGSRPAAFISEPLLGSQGGVVPAAGYLRGAYGATRTAGALCIADEIQVGYGRTGETFWAFEAEGTVPDILVAAKSVGNGHPIGFVACRPAISDAFARSRSFFSTSGGGPVSCRIGSAVLNVIHDENLQANARVVGKQLKHDLGELAKKHASIGAVHGRGLYLGVDLVALQDSTVPMPEGEVLAVAERMRRLGVITQPTGIHLNVLKVKPPMCITLADANYFVEQLDRALTDLGSQPRLPDLNVNEQQRSRT